MDANDVVAAIVAATERAQALFVTGDSSGYEAMFVTPPWKRHEGPIAVTPAARRNGW